MKADRFKAAGLIRSVILLVLGIVYLALLAVTFASGIELASDKAMQYILHVDVILSAVAYLLFADTIYKAEKDEENGRLALIFAALFAVPILVGRGIGLAAISVSELSAPDSLYNFYAGVSISRTVELVGWTTLFPLSMLFFAKLFFKKRVKYMACLCLLSSVCCFIAFLSIVSSSIIYLFIGVAGWGILFLMVIIAYMSRHMHNHVETLTK
jgi:hypothetical protein